MLNPENPVLHVALKDFNPELVGINSAAIAALSLQDPVGPVPSPVMSPALQAPSAGQAMYCLAMCSLNYQFWSLGAALPDTPQRSFERYEHNGQVGAWAMQQAFEEEWLRVLGEDLEAPVSRQRELLRDNFCGSKPLTAAGITRTFGRIHGPAHRAHILQEMFASEYLEYIAQAFFEVLSYRSLNWQDAKLLAHLFPSAYQDPYLKKAGIRIYWLI